jgi:hypothetical protein
LTCNIHSYLKNDNPKSTKPFQALQKLQKSTHLEKLPEKQNQLQKTTKKLKSESEESHVNGDEQNQVMAHSDTMGRVAEILVANNKARYRRP